MRLVSKLVNLKDSAIKLQNKDGREWLTLVRLFKACIHPNETLPKNSIVTFRAQPLTVSAYYRYEPGSNH